jgi:hypothetical protein
VYPAVTLSVFRLQANSEDKMKMIGSFRLIAIALISPFALLSRRKRIPFINLRLALASLETRKDGVPIATKPIQLFVWKMQIVSGHKIAWKRPWWGPLLFLSTMM